MNNSLIVLLAVLIGLMVGIGITWFFSRLRLQAATEQGKAEVSIELASAQARIRALEEERGQTSNAFAQLRTQADAWRNELDRVSDERAMLGERASRLPQLEQKLTEAAQSLENFNRLTAQLRESIGRTEAELASEREGHVATRENYQVEKKQREQADARLAQQEAERSRLETQLAAERQQAAEKLSLLLNAKEELSNQFKSLANDILEEKAKRFTEQNQTNLGQLLDPLKLRLQEFQAKVETVYVQEGKDRTALAEQVRQLMELNQSLSQDAKNLTTALKGSNKTQGNWGELVLERVLEASGLRKGEEYDVQESHSREDGSRAQPDVVVHLPEDRHLIIDAKMSLTAYEEFVSTEDESARQLLLKRHLDSVRGHIRELSDKHYQTLYGLKSLDFVLMFVPVEPAFMLAVTHDKDIFMDAWQKNVLLVSPSTLLFVVRTVAHLWRQEAQNRNAQDIAKRGAELYDKFVGFVTDLDSLGDRLRQAQETYDRAYGKFTTGRGNVIRQADMLRKLGVKPTKTLPVALVEKALDDEQDNCEEADGALLPATEPAMTDPINS